MPKRANSLFLGLFVRFSSSSSCWLQRWCPLQASLKDMHLSGLPATWVSLSPLKLTHKIGPDMGLAGQESGGEGQFLSVQELLACQEQMAGMCLSAPGAQQSTSAQGQGSSADSHPHAHCKWEPGQVKWRWAIHSAFFPSPRQASQFTLACKSTFL